MISKIAEATNLYSLEKKASGFFVSSNEMLKYIGILIHMGVVCMPDYRMYWARDTRYNQIARVMSRNRFDAIKSNFHLADNNELPRNRISSDKLFKFRPLYEHVQSNCRLIDPEENNSIDEQIVPWWW